MSKFSIDKKTLGEFLRLNELAGAYGNHQLAIMVKSDAISAEINLRKVLLVRSSITGKFEDWGEICMEHFSSLKNTLLVKSATAIARLSKVENNLICDSDNQKFQFRLCSPQVITNRFDEYTKFQEKVDQIKKGSKFVLKPEDIKMIKKYSNVMGLKRLPLFLSGEKETITVRFDGTKSSSFLNFSSINKIETQFSIEFTSLFQGILDLLNGYRIY